MKRTQALDCQIFFAGYEYSILTKLVADCQLREPERMRAVDLTQREVGQQVNESAVMVPDDNGSQGVVA